MYESACRYRETQWISDTQYNIIIVLPRMHNITFATRKSKDFNDGKDIVTNSFLYEKRFVQVFLLFRFVIIKPIRIQCTNLP